MPLTHLTNKETKMRFDTFNEVVSGYERIKPLVSKNHTLANDVRPIGDRKRKWERIRKVDAETYCLLDGYYGSTMWNTTMGDAQYEQDMAPIMWKREADGDYIYIRNGVKGSTPFLRYQFLGQYMPMKLRFQYNRQGKHWVHATTPTGVEDFPLPKTDYRWDYQRKAPGKDDNKRLKFKANEDGTFTRVGDAFKVAVSTLDKELKKQWKARIDAFYTQAAVLAPMLDTTWHGRNEYHNIISEWGNENGIDIPIWGGLNHIPTALVRGVVEQEDHPLRISLMALVIHNIGGKRAIVSKADLRAIRAAYNRLMNKALGMYEIKEI
jgi:hypothetical protein